jgi:hypothetical protein
MGHLSVTAARPTRRPPSLAPFAVTSGWPVLATRTCAGTAAYDMVLDIVRDAVSELTSPIAGAVVNPAHSPLLCMSDCFRRSAVHDFFRVVLQ